MQLKQLKEWLETIPAHFLDYYSVYSTYEEQEGAEVQTWIRTDKPITTCFIDEESLECTFSSNRPEALCKNKVDRQPVAEPPKKSKTTKRKKK